MPEKTIYHFHFHIFFLKKGIGTVLGNGNDIGNIADIGISETGPSERNIPILVGSRKFMSESPECGITHI